MVWQPAAYDGSCSGNSGNHSAPLMLVCFLIRHFSRSNDELLKDLYGNKNVNDDNYDFIVVGAGAAGCVVANRLSERSDWKVLLLEAGDEEPQVAEVPGLYAHLQNSNIDYAYRTNDTKPESYNRGKVMGGSTSINGVFYARGFKADYDDWAKNGNEGWGWENVLPYFKKLESAKDTQNFSKYAESHDTKRYLTVGQFPVEDKNTILFMDAFKEVGFDDVDGSTGDRIGVFRKPVTTIHGTRLSTNGAYIRPIRGKRPNLVVKPNSRVTRIIIDPDKKRATGVEYETTDENGTVTKKVNAKKDVIVSGGVIESPKLLMLSGIGPRDHLEQLNITVIKDLPVGLNFRDHIAVELRLTSNETEKSISDEKVLAGIFEWINTREGPQSWSPTVNIAGLYQTKFENHSGAADIQYNVNGVLGADDSLINLFIAVVFFKPKSTGSIKLNSVDPVNNQPDIRLNPLSDSHDLDALLEGVKFARNIANTQKLRNAGFTVSTIPVPECQDIEINSDDYLRCLVENKVINYLHGVGTCKMGPKTDEQAVINPRLKVYGIDGLRVIDASIMPDIVRGNTMGPTIMIGEKGSDIIKEDYL